MQSTGSGFLKARQSHLNRLWLTLAALLLFVSAAPAQTIVTLTDQGTPAANGTALQNAIDLASLNTRIILPAGVTYQRSSGIVLKYTPPGTGYITIESAN